MADGEEIVFLCRTCNVDRRLMVDDTRMDGDFRHSRGHCSDCGADGFVSQYRDSDAEPWEEYVQLPPYPDEIRNSIAVGDLMHNCSMCEAMIVTWLKVLMSDVEFAVVCEQMASRQAAELRKLAPQCGVLQPRLRKAIKRCRGVANIRNVVAHKPFVFGLAPGVPVGWLRFKLKSGKRPKPLARRDVLKAVEEADAVLQELRALFREHTGKEPLVSGW